VTIGYSGALLVAVVIVAVDRSSFFLFKTTDEEL